VTTGSRSARLLLGALLAPLVGVAMAPGPLGPPLRAHRFAPVLALGVVRGPAGAGLSHPPAQAALQQTLAAPAAPAPPAVPPASPPATAAAPTPPPPPSPPSALAAALEARLADPRLAGLSVGLSVWLDGFGEAAARNADLPLLPASNQKLVTAMGILAQVPITDTLVTEVRATGAQDGARLAGDLILVGGGDPTLTIHGPHSLDALAAAVRARGITRVAGTLVADETRYDSVRGAGGWLPQHVPVFIGPLSALVVDRNQHRGDPYAADPLPGNLVAFRHALARQGVSVAGGDAAGPTPAGAVTLAALASPHIGALVTDMLIRSDNLAAELLVKELGRRVRGVGSTVEGLSSAEAALANLGVHLAGHSADGSGLSRADRRSAREFQELLRAALSQPWGNYLLESLPLAGRTGTLTRRLRGTAAEANVRAKTGWIDEGRALSGYLTTAGGRRAVFSVVVNGTVPGSPVVGAIDDLVATVAADRS
jgi:D-alanyl-D-alanine carboxypeptidase/D-alanyl-D-alanine-endopeptidase (penicillin-binding protein 4)